MIPAIPRYLLPHKAVFKRKISEDKWGGAEYEETSLAYVRIAPCHGMRFSLGGDVPEVSAKMFFDHANSLPCPAPDFQSGDVIAFNGKDYVVKKVNTFYADGDEVHHLEVELSCVLILR